MTKIFITSEHQCRKISGQIPFSKPVAFWLHMKWAYQALARVAMRTCQNLGNARQRAKCAQLYNLNLSADQCFYGICYDKWRINQLKHHAMDGGEEVLIVHASKGKGNMQVGYTCTGRVWHDGDVVRTITMPRTNVLWIGLAGLLVEDVMLVEAVTEDAVLAASNT